jgi:hypothetical protein
MGRNVPPLAILALSPQQAAKAFGLRWSRVNDAIAAGELTVRKAGAARRIPVFGIGGLMQWFDTWPKAVATNRGNDHVDETHKG